MMSLDKSSDWQCGAIYSKHRWSNDVDKMSSCKVYENILSNTLLFFVVDKI